MGFASRLGEGLAGTALAYGLSGQPALAETPSSSHEQVAETKKMRVTEAAASNGGLNLRAAPNRNGEVLGKIPVGTEVTVTRVDGDWAEVTFTFAGVTETGWAAIQLGEVDYLEHAVFKMHVTEAAASNEGLNLRAAPNRDGEVLGKIPVHTDLTVVRVDGDWAEVSFMVGQTKKKGWAAIRVGDTVYLEEGEFETPAESFAERMRQDAVSDAMGLQRAEALAAVARKVVSSYRPQPDAQDPLCDIESIGSIERVPSGMPRRKEPLTCVVGLNNAYFFLVETPVSAACLDVLKSEIDRSPALTGEMARLCEWGYVRNPDASDSVYMVASCEGNSNLGKTSPEEGYAVLNWGKADPNVVHTDFDCRE